MRSVTSCFNKAIFLNNIKRFWPLWTIYNIIWVISLPVALPGLMSRNLSSVSVSRYVLQLGVTEGAIMGLIFGLLSAWTVFSYLYTAKSTAAFHTLPIRRECLFLSSFLSGLVWLLASNVFIFVLSVLAQLLFGTLQIGYLLQWLGIVSLQCVFFFGFGSFCAILTGQGFALVAIYGVLNFAAVIIESIMRYCLSLFSYGVISRGSMTFGTLSPVYRILSKIEVERHLIAPEVYSYSFGGWPILIIYCVAGLLFAAAGLLLYKRRKSESASEFIAFSALRPVFKYFFAFIGSLVLGALFYTIIFESSNYEATGSALPMLFCMALGGFLGYYITAMLLHKSFRVFKKTTTGFIVYTLALIALVMAFEFDVFGIERYVPDFGSVASVNISTNGYSLNYDDEVVIGEISKAHKSITANKSAHENYLRQNSSKILSPEEEYPRTVYLSINYSLKNGKTVYRRYNLSSGSEIDLQNIRELEEAFNTTEAIVDNMSDILAIPIDSINAIDVHYPDKDGVYSSEIIVKDSARDFFENYIKADIRSGKFNRVSLLDINKLKFDFSVSIRTNIKAANDPEYNETSYYTSPGEDAEKTLAFLKEMGIEPAFDFDDEVINKYYKD